MEFLTCKACGSIGMVPMDVTLLDEADDAAEDGPELTQYLAESVDTEHDRGDEKGDEETEDQDEESRFYSCHVCGDNWLSIRRHDDEGQSKVTFIHQMGVQPILRRIAHVHTAFVIGERTVDHWEYYLDDDEVAEGEWMGKLDDRRKVLKAICSN